MKITIGEKIKILVDRSGFTQDAIKKQTGLSQATLHKIYDNKGTIGSWIVLCKLLKCNLDITLIEDQDS